MVAWSTSMIGMSSFTAYTRWHCLHFKLSGFSRYSNACLHAGQTRISSKSLAIMTAHCTPHENQFTTETQSHGENKIRGLRANREPPVLSPNCFSVSPCLRGE